MAAEETHEDLDQVSMIRPSAERKPNYSPGAYPTQNGFSSSNMAEEEKEKEKGKNHRLKRARAANERLMANKGDGNIVSGSDQLRRAGYSRESDIKKEKSREFRSPRRFFFELRFRSDDEKSIFISRCE